MRLSFEERLKRNMLEEIHTSDTAVPSEGAIRVSEDFGYNNAYQMLCKQEACFHSIPMLSSTATGIP
jgi:hypothetical protein